MRRFGFPVIAMLFVTTGAVLASAALRAEDLTEEQAAAVIKYRQQVMETMGGLMGIVGGRLRDGLDFGPDLGATAAALVAVTADIPALFPAGSDFGETDALPKVWTDGADFAASAKEAADAAVGLAAAVKGGDRQAMLSAMQKVGQACKGCHSDYRADD